jgi:DNA-binding response OmpR family regulator
MDVLKVFRSQSDTPVMVLSASNDTQTKVRALQLGADDYMTKPFSSEELIERTRAHMRRPALQRVPTYEADGLCIDYEKRQVWVNQQRVQNQQQL